MMLELAIYVMVFQGLGSAVAEDNVYNSLVAFAHAAAVPGRTSPKCGAQSFSAVLELSRTPFAELGMQRCRLMLNVARP